MSDPGAVSAAREQFCQRVRGKNAMRARPGFDADEYNAHIDATDSLVSKWAEQDVARDVLLPLLGHDDAAIRVSAASYLLRNGGTDEALAVLNELGRARRSRAGSA